ncbi:hypothetical protein [Streptomyces sp. NBC_01190]|nr:hypothetical protein OG519_17310 [Streptomyces sp. NBC_01190]
MHTSGERGAPDEYAAAWDEWDGSQDAGLWEAVTADGTVGRPAV